MNGAVRLRWSSHHTTLMSMIDTFLMDESLVDVTLTCEGQTIQAHKLILSACSPYLQKMLNTAERLDPIIFLTGVKFSQLQALIQFIYRGEVNISQADLPSFLTLAEDLQIKGLSNSNTKRELESVTQSIRSRILGSNKKNPTHTKWFNTPRPPPLKRARPTPPPMPQSDEEEEHDSFPEDYPNGTDSVDSGHSQPKKYQHEQEQLENSDCETSIHEVDDIDEDHHCDKDGDKITAKDITSKPACDWMDVLGEEGDDENSAEQEQSYTEQDLNRWGLGNTEGLEMIPDPDDDDDLEQDPDDFLGIAATSRNSTLGNDEPTSCPLCNKQFQKRKTWNTHCLYDCPMVPPKYNCTICDYRARRGYQLKIHCLKIHGIVS